jgi:hypothetical protein
MGHVAEDAVNAAKLVTLLVLALAWGGFSYTLGYATGAERSSDHLGRQLEETFRDSWPSLGDGVDQARPPPSGGGPPAAAEASSPRDGAAARRGVQPGARTADVPAPEKERQ